MFWRQSSAIRSTTDKPPQWSTPRIIWETIRARRAYAAHDITLVARIDDAVLPMVLTTDCKGRLVFRDGAEVDLNSILLIARHCRALAFYLRGVVARLQWEKTNPPRDAIRPALPDRPPLPMGSPVGL